MAADYKTPQWLLPNELNMSLNPALSESRHSLYSMEFDGTDDFIQVGQTTDVIIDFSKPWSVSWWAKWTYSPSFDCFWQFGSTSSPVRYVLAWVNSTGIGYSISNSASVGIGYNIANGLNDGNWHNIVFTGNGDTSGSGIINIYIDGVLNTDTPTGTGAGASSLTMNNIGRGYATTGRYFNGSIDELAIWNKELNQSEIDVLSVANSPANLMALPTKPVAYYPLSEEAQMGYSNWNFPNGSLQSRTIEFDGTGYISVTPTPFTDFTVSFWINPSTTVSATYDGILGSGTIAAQGGILRYVAYDGSASVGNVLLYLGGAWIGVAALTNGEWSNVILTYDSTADEFKSYKNGTLDTTISSPDFSGQTTDAHSFVDIGRRNGTAGTIFNGKISNVALWNSSQVINVDNIYNNGTPQSTYTVTPNNWWKLNVDDSTYDTATSTWTFTDGPGTNDGTSTTLPSTALVPSDLQFESPYSNYSLNFDGVDDYIETSGPNITSGGFSFSAWVKTSDTVNNQVIWNGIDSTTAKSFVRITGTALRVKIIDGSGGSNNIDNTVTTADGNWHHIAFTTDGLTTTNGVIVYVDGQELAVKGTLSNAGFASTTKNQIGSYATNTWNFNGNIDEVAMWSSVLTQAQIAQVYNNGYPGDLTSLSPISWWRLGEDAYFVSNVVTIPNKITGGPSGTGGGGDQSAFLVGDAPGSYGNGLGDSLDVFDRIGDAPQSTENSVSINMIPSNRHSYPAGYLPTQVNNVFSMAFDGINDYFDTSYIIPAISNWSVSFWANIVDPSNSNYYYYITARNSSTTGLIVWSGSGSASSQRNFTAKINSTTITFSVASFATWYNIVITGDGSNLTAYVDGVQVATTAISTLFPTLTYTTKIGSNKDGTNYFFNGQLDEVAIFDYALSARQIKQDIYNGTTTGKTADLNNISNLTAPVAWYRMGD
jgi:hypothetical protein